MCQRSTTKNTTLADLLERVVLAGRDHDGLAREAPGPGHGRPVRVRALDLRAQLPLIQVPEGDAAAAGRDQDGLAVSAEAQARHGAKVLAGKGKRITINMLPQKFGFYGWKASEFFFCKIWETRSPVWKSEDGELDIVILSF